MPKFMARAALALLALLLACPAHAAGVERFAQMDGAKIHYTDHGQGDEAVVLVHGWGGDSTFWHEQIPVLAALFRVIAVDLPGHGQSDAPVVAYTQPYFADAVEAVLAQASVKRAVVVGHSMGFNVARVLALRHPGRVAGLVSVDGAIQIPPKDPAQREAWQKENQAFGQAFARPGGQQLARKFVDSLHGPQTPPAVRQWVSRHVLAGPWTPKLSAMLNFVDPSVAATQVIHKPLLAIYVQSPHIAPDFQARLKELFPDLRFQLWQGLGHFYMLSQPERLNHALVEFCAELIDDCGCARKGPREAGG